MGSEYRKVFQESDPEDVGRRQELTRDMGLGEF